MTVKWSRVSAFVLALIFAASFCWADESSKSDKNVSEEPKFSTQLCLPQTRASQEMFWRPPNA